MNGSDAVTPKKYSRQNNLHDLKVVFHKAVVRFVFPHQIKYNSCMFYIYIF
jgi:hypothetical protein